MLPTVKDLPVSLAVSTVWLRVDWNVDFKDGVVAEDYRIERTFPTIDLLRARGARVIIGTHLSDPAASLDPVVAYVKTKFDLTGVEVLPNLRTYPGEETGDETLARTWAGDADFYVNEAFAVSHRRHASIVSLPRLMPAYAGLNLAAEVAVLSELFKPVQSLLLIIGGDKLESKRPVLDKFLPLVDQVVVGGALVYDFIDQPTDKIVISSHLVRRGDRIVDVWPDDRIKSLVASARRIIWAGPMGIYNDGYPEGTLKLAEIVFNSSAEVVIGGGDTVTAIADLLRARHWRLKPGQFISTGGGAMLQFLATGTLPGIEALKR